MISVAEALARVLALATPLPEETVPLRGAAGRVLARPVAAKLTQPPFDAATMDGYWLATADATPGAVLRVVAEAAAGHAHAGALAPGEALRIFTGAPCPDRPGRVIPQEDVRLDGNRIALPAVLPAQVNIRPRGQDFCLGTEVFPRRPLTARDLGLMAAMNLPTLPVHRRPVVAIIATGDELVLPGDTPGPDQIIVSNSFLLAAEAERWGAVARMLPLARDTEESLRAIFAQAQDADLVLTSGGASVGDHDLVGKVATEMGMERAFWKVAMKPGKPLMAGRMGGAVLLGLPGNPVAAAVCADLFLRPILLRFQGLDAPPHMLRATLGCDLPAEGPRDHYLRARLAPVASAGVGASAGLPVITPFGTQDSAMLRVLAEADALALRPAHAPPAKAGDSIDYLPLQSFG